MFRAHYDLIKNLKQASLSYDQFYAARQNQLSLCQYPTETHNILESDIFLYGLSDQMFMPNIITDCANLTAVEICQRLKKLESGQVTATHISNSNGNNAGVNQLHGKKPLQSGKKLKCGNHQGTQTGEQPTNPP